jgi:hypothetical protein
LDVIIGFVANSTWVRLSREYLAHSDVFARGPVASTADKSPHHVALFLAHTVLSYEPLSYEPEVKKE